MHLSDIREQLIKNGYLANNEIVMAVYGALHGVPLLVESDPGQGKTSLAMAMGKAFQLPVLRVQFYEGLTDDKILYDTTTKDSFSPFRRSRVPYRKI